MYDTIQYFLREFIFLEQRTTNSCHILLRLPFFHSPMKKGVAIAICFRPFSLFTTTPSQQQNAKKCHQSYVCSLSCHTCHASMLIAHKAKIKFYIFFTTFQSFMNAKMSQQNSKSKDLGHTMRTGLSRQSQQYLTTYRRVLSQLLFTISESLSRLILNQSKQNLTRNSPLWILGLA